MDNRYTLPDLPLWLLGAWTALLGEVAQAPP